MRRGRFPTIGIAAVKKPLRAAGVTGWGVALLSAGCHPAPPAVAPDVETVLGARAAVAGHPAEATRHFRQALETDPGSVEKRYVLAVSLKNEGKLMAALPFFETVAASGDKDFIHPARIEIEFIHKRLRP